MTFWQFLNHWWNLPYLVMLGLVGAYFALQAVGLLADAASPEADVAQEVDHDVDHDADHDSEQEHGLTEFLGVSRVPFMVVWLTLFIFAGFSGLFLNRVLQVRTGGYAGWFFPISLLASSGVGLLSVRFAAKAVGRLVDTGGRGATARRDLRGAIGVVASPKLDARFGEVRVRDPQGNELIVHGHVGEEEEELKQGEKVVLMELEKETGLFEVAAFKE